MSNLLVSRRARLTVALLCQTWTMLGCTDAARRGSVLPATKEHGIAIGALASTDSVDCSDGGHERPVPLPPTPLLLTFASAADCALCESHVSTMDSIRSAGSLPFEYRVVFSADPERRESTASALRVATSTPLCYDVASRLWQSYGIARTPFTVLIADSRVRYINDRFLTSPVEQKALLADLSSAAKRLSYSYRPSANR